MPNNKLNMLGWSSICLWDELIKPLDLNFSSNEMIN